MSMEDWSRIATDIGKKVVDISISILVGRSLLLALALGPILILLFLKAKRILEIIFNPGK